MKNDFLRCRCGCGRIVADDKIYYDGHEPIITEKEKTENSRLQMLHKLYID